MKRPWLLVSGLLTVVAAVLTLVCIDLRLELPFAVAGSRLIGKLLGLDTRTTTLTALLCVDKGSRERWEVILEEFRETHPKIDLRRRHKINASTIGEERICWGSDNRSEYSIPFPAIGLED